ncbi:MAG: CMD domain-containing protein [Parvibaculaceae bacterium]
MSDIVLELAGIVPGSPLAAVLAGRAGIFELTQKTHDAALTPAEPGGLSHALRAALACRIAGLNRDEAFARHFKALLERAGAGDEDRKVAELSFTGGDPRRRAVIRHTDLVAGEPRAATGGDIDALRKAGIAEPDIVRLSELVAFVSYQIRVVQGLRLMREAA